MNMKYADVHIKYAGGLQMFLLLEFLGFLTKEIQPQHITFAYTLLKY